MPILSSLTNLEKICISFGDMHPEASTKKGKASIHAYSGILKVTKYQGSGHRQTASHKKYDF